jgi:rubredoxin
MPKIWNLSERLQRQSTESNRFHLQGEYSCPVCRHGKVSAMPLMETFACNFCQHIFITNFDKQLLKMADSQLPLTWYWNGKNWKGIHREGSEIGWSYLLFALAFVLLPTGIIGFGTYLFPPAPDSPLSWLPLFWCVVTFFAHLSCLIWLIIEYYQFPIFLYIRAIKRRFSPRNWFA